MLPSEIVTKQQKLFKWKMSLNTRFGGALLEGKRKSKRELQNRSNIHLVLRSTWATGPWSLLKHARPIQKILNNKAQSYYIEIKSLANAGNHLHIILYMQNKRYWAPFIREISNEIMKIVTGCKRGTPLMRDLADSSLKSKNSIFWTLRPFTRIISAAKDLWHTKHYLKLNSMEIATGLARPAARKLLMALEAGP